VQAGAQRVVAVGGDGTVHEVANGLLRSPGGADVALGVVPIGSGNDFAKLVGAYGHSPVRAVRRLVTAQTARFDAGLVCEEYFVNSVGFGFGPEVVRVRNAMPGLSGFRLVLRTGWFAPSRAIARSASTCGRADSPKTGYMMMMEVCNGTTAGGSYRFAPGCAAGRRTAGRCLVRRVSLLRFLMAVPARDARDARHHG